MRGVLFLAAVSLSVCAQEGAKRPLSHRDYDGWRTIQTPTLSRDGRWLAYGLFPQDEDGQFVIRDLKTGSERKEPAGVLPPPPEPDPEAEPDRPPEPPAIRIAFTRDSRFVAFSTFASKADRDRAKSDRKPAPKGGMGVLGTDSGGSATHVPNVKSFQVPERGGAVLVYLREAAAATEEPNQDAGTARAQYGTELVIRDLALAYERSISDVLEYVLAKDGADLVYATAGRNELSNGVYRLQPGTPGAAQPLLSGKGKYQKLVWDVRQTKLAFLSDREDARANQPRARLYLWNRGAPSAHEIVSPATQGFREKWGISDRGPIAFSRDSRRVFFGTAPVREAPAKASPGQDAVMADLWHYRDPRIQPMQQVRAGADRNRSWRAVYHIEDAKFVQLGDESLPGILPSDDGRLAAGVDDRAYRPLIDYEGAWADLYLVDTANGSRKRIAEKVFGAQVNAPPVHWSPDGRHLLLFRDRNWHVVNSADGSAVNITAALPVRVFEEEQDIPQEPGAYGTAGWTQDGEWVLIYDRYDVWQISADGKIARNVTDGVGRREKTHLRVVRVQPQEDEEPRGIRVSDPLFLRAENTETRDSGFWRDRLDGEAAPVKLVTGPRNYRWVTKSRDADVVVVTASRFNEYPDLQVTSLAMKELRKVSDANPQMARLRWGSAELISYRSADGVPLKAALYKPDGFDRRKKYPMLVYIYEKLSQNVHTFPDPRPGTSPSIAWYVSNGYLVLTPDIVYSTGQPGQSALKCVLPAVDAAVSTGGVDEAAIGIAGHSWGGYQAAYLVTQTRRFRAAEAGAPVANMTSAYNGIRWGTGRPRQFQYEHTQSRIGGSLWEQPMLFLENSPVFHIRNVATPMLLLHNDADDAVPWYQGIELFLSLRRNGKEAYLFNYNGEKHGLRRRHNQKDWTIRMQQFFDHYLKGAPKPEWMEKGIPFLEREREKLRFSVPDSEGHAKLQ